MQCRRLDAGRGIVFFKMLFCNRRIGFGLGFGLGLGLGLGLGSGSGFGRVTRYNSKTVCEEIFIVA